MYIAIRSVYWNYDDFRSPVKGAMKPLRACFGCFECTFPLASIKNYYWLQKNYRYISVYLWSIFNYFHKSRRHTTRATIKIAIAIENGRSFKLRQSDKADCVAFHSTTTECEAHRAVPSPFMGPWKRNRGWGGRMEEDGKEMERQEGMQVPRWAKQHPPTIPPHCPLPTH